MSHAHEQLKRAIENAAKRGERVVGYRPKTGHPQHPDGSLILSIETAPIRKPAPAPEPPKPIINRGVRAGARPRQELLL